MNTTTFHHNPFEAGFELLHKIELRLARAFKTFYAAVDAAQLSERGHVLTVQDMKRLGLFG